MKNTESMRVHYSEDVAFDTLIEMIHRRKACLEAFKDIPGFFTAVFDADKYKEWYDNDNRLLSLKTLVDNGIMILDHAEPIYSNYSGWFDKDGELVIKESQYDKLPEAGREMLEPQLKKLHHREFVLGEHKYYRYNADCMTNMVNLLRECATNKIRSKITGLYETIHEYEKKLDF